MGIFGVSKYVSVPLGALAVWTFSVLSDSDERALAALANNASVAIENTRLQSPRNDLDCGNIHPCRLIACFVHEPGGPQHEKTGEWVRAEMPRALDHWRGRWRNGRGGERRHAG